MKAYRDSHNVVVTSTIRPPFDSHSTAIRPRDDHSTIYFMVVGLPVYGLLQ